jgi:hypothetical protein
MRAAMVCENCREVGAVIVGVGDAWLMSGDEQLGLLQ